MSEQEAVKEAVEGQELSAEGKSRFGTKEKLIKDLTAKLEESKNLEEQSVKLREQAEALAEENPEEAEKLRAEAGELEAKAKKLIKTARRMQNGAFQGGAAGAGIGAGIAGGLGTVVGSLVGGIAAIPTTGLGILIGAGTGAIHGPWVKLVKDTVQEEDEKAEKGEDSSDGEE
ncbi:hypothetical protein PFICI_07531 [Pestalotiopsis fici W106-1]|uniref:Uncharacterized protein n=1 Tax=Pestalotiopsis fici (strain W106-1 / CGMCC3.15140) TaxID=1229662 RepID=W3X3L2_PESFW|nr:uncharacterized protein PFICI_07531 [Pestalotiopsis fici W106-1]ETS80002.1 hypothetical protein PFICI_07531 [Pestalotiopsis fici W106-1]